MIENVGDLVSGMPYADESSSAIEDMAAFDQLPTMIRKAVARFPVALESPAVLESYENGASAIQIITALRELEAEFYQNAYSDRGVNLG